MSVFSLSTGESTITLDESHSLAHTQNFSIAPNSTDEKNFLLLANSHDAVCASVQALPDYEDPRTLPCAVHGGERKFYRPSDDENPLGAWACRTELRARDVGEGKDVLKGRTVAIKENVSVGGLPHGLGTEAGMFEGGQYPTSPMDATIVARILAAGGTIKGTATCENLSVFALSYSSASGNVHNAWAPGYATGGSSSGCGALVSIADVENARRTGKDDRTYPLGKGVDMAMGGDQGGSVRFPAAYSGIYGLKATYGLVPYTGIASLNPLIDTTGPMARTVEDIALFLSVTAGYDDLDFRMTPETPLRSNVPNYLNDLESWIARKKSLNEWNQHSAAKGLRIGILTEAWEIATLSPSVAHTLQTAIARFRTLGAELKQVSALLHKSAAAIYTIAQRPQIPPFMSNKVPDLLSHPMPHLRPAPIDQDFYNTLVHRNPAPLNLLLNAAQQESRYGPGLARKAYMHIHQLRAAYDKIFDDDDVDVILTPLNPTVAPRFPSSTLKSPENMKGLTEDFMDVLRPAVGNTLNTCPFNVTGHPAMSMPVGWGVAEDDDDDRKMRLPVGMQVVAKRWEEGMIFRAARAWEVGGRWSDL